MKKEWLSVDGRIAVYLDRMRGREPAKESLQTDV
jgi:hypothetical protein